jgi:hypothetical protein
LALRCGNDIVEIGDRRIEVASRCGEPAWKEDRTEATAVKVFRDREHGDLIDERRSYSTVEEWVYNFGPTRFLYFLRFENGKLTDVQTGGYGYLAQKPAEPDVRCWSESMARGQRKIELLRDCGEPASVDVYEEERVRTVADRKRKRFIERRVTVVVEDWVYNFGPHRLLSVFTFENGRVVGVSTRGYGF